MALYPYELFLIHEYKQGILAFDKNIFLKVFLEMVFKSFYNNELFCIRFLVHNPLHNVNKHLSYSNKSMKNIINTLLLCHHMKRNTYANYMYYNALILSLFTILYFYI